MLSFNSINYNPVDRFQTDPSFLNEESTSSTLAYSSDSDHSSDTETLPAASVDTPMREVKATTTKRSFRGAVRQFFTTHAASTVSQNESDKSVGKFNEEDLVNHGLMRVALAAISFVALYGIGKKTNQDETVPFDIDTDIIRAYNQAGKATNNGEHNYHALHQHAAAGYVDNYRIALIQRIAQNGQITPNSKRMLRAKGFTEIDFKVIVDNCHNIDKITEIFDRVWAINPLRPQSIFSGTRTEVNLNATTEAPRLANLAVDKGVEAFIRPKIKELYKKVIYAEMTPEEAAIEYCNLLQGYFDFVIKNLDTKIDLISIYEKQFQGLEKYKNMNEADVDVAELEQLVRNLHQKALVLMPPKSKEKAAPLKKITNIDSAQKPLTATIPRAKIQKNKDFLNNSLYQVKKDPENPLTVFFCWMQKRFDVIKKEVSDQHTKLNTYLKYSQLERQGTQPPDFTTLFGAFNPETGTRELSKETLALAQETLWKPITPEKKADDPEPPQKKRKTTIDNAVPRKLVY